jgi:dinuclear metal center YbgI/SA1388 family protein
MNVMAVSGCLESVAPVALACDWDNVGLLVGDGDAGVSKLLLCIDLTEAVLDEAIARGCEMVMAYHPPIFRGLKTITASRAPVVYRAIRAGVAVYSMHTALDVAAGGTNDTLAEVVGLVDAQPLEESPSPAECKMVVFVPAEALPEVSAAAFSAGAGRIGTYRDCSYASQGVGTFYGEAGSAPAVGNADEAMRVDEIRLEMICPAALVDFVSSAVVSAHPYETPAIDLYPLRPNGSGLGMGRIGSLSELTSLATMVDRIKSALGLKHLLLAEAQGQPISQVAVAAGSAGESFRVALTAGAQLYLTGEMRHHDVLAATAAGMAVICVCHSNSERITLEKLAPTLTAKLRGVEVLVSDACRDPFEIV